MLSTDFIFWNFFSLMLYLYLEVFYSLVFFSIFKNLKNFNINYTKKLLQFIFKNSFFIFINNIIIILFITFKLKLLTNCLLSYLIIYLIISKILSFFIKTNLMFINFNILIFFLLFFFINSYIYFFLYIELYSIIFYFFFYNIIYKINFI